MTLIERVRRFTPDPYVLAILAMVLLATLTPVTGAPARIFSSATKAAIALLFFLHGAKLSREAVVGGLVHWRLHMLVLAATFVLFPVLGIALRGLAPGILSPALATGVLFLCCLPSTVQSSIAFTALARGNVAAAVCAASLSNLIGVVLTPLLTTVAIGAHGGGNALGAVRSIALQLLLPFLAGQLARPRLAGWLGRHARLTGYVDRGSILMVVYAAFSAAVADGLWSRLTATELLGLALICAALLAMVLAITAWVSKILGFSIDDRIAIVFCGSKKSLASGVPMASILFPASAVGLLVLPLMIFHQLQLMACALIAQRWAARPS